jgi:hypothetical protein
MCCEYWKDDWHKVRPCWNTGFVLDVFKVVFWAIRKISIINPIAFCIRKHCSDTYAYIAVDSYVIVLLLLAIGFITSLSNSISAPTCEFRIVLLAFTSYRLLDVFQSWMGNFFISDPRPKNPYRTLVLTFIGYGEIILWYSILYFLFKHDFGIASLQESLYYALGTASIGAGLQPMTNVSTVIFGTQIMFAVLFLTVIVNKIITVAKQS